MAGKQNEDRERALVEDFFSALDLDARVVRMRDKPDAQIEVHGMPIGMEITELLQPADGKDRSLEAHAEWETRELCRELLAPSGSVDVRINARPPTRQQVDEWLAAFRQWLVADRESILAEGGVDAGEFPPNPSLARAQLELMRAGNAEEEYVEEAAARLREAEDLAWMTVESIRIEAGDHGWHGFAAFDGEHLADRHEDSIDDMVIDAISKKCRKAADYDFDGPIWLLVRVPFKATLSDEIERRVLELPGIERFEQVWLMTILINVLDGGRPPVELRRLR